MNKYNMKSILHITLIVMLSMAILSTSIKTNSTTQVDWRSFSLNSDDVNSISIFKSNNTYAYELSVTLNITELYNGELEFGYEKGDTIPHYSYNSIGLYSANITTLSAHLSVFGTNVSATGFYKMEIGKKVSQSPYLTANVLFILGLLSIKTLTSIGVPFLLSIVIVITFFVELFIATVYITIKGYKNWRKNKNNKKLAIFGLELGFFIITTFVFLFPFRYSMF